MPRKNLDICAFCSAPTWCRKAPDGRPICGGCHVVKFFRWLYRPLGFTLLDWQSEVLRAIYGSALIETGERRVQTAYVEVCKKNGKSFLLGGLPLYHLVKEFDDEELDRIQPRAYGAAAAKDQAGLIFDAALRLYRANEDDFKRYLKPLPSTKRILRRDNRGFYAVLSADGDLQDGIEPSLALIDELHRWNTRKAHTLHDVMLAGMIAREEGLGIEITTAGDVYESPLCWQRHERARLWQGSDKSDRFYGRIWGADEEKLKSDPEYWKSRQCRVDANPSHEDLGGFLKDDRILGMLEELGEPAYKRYNLGIWGQRVERWMPMDAWRACAAPLRPLIGRECWLGLDLSKTTDLTALVAVFPDASDQSFDILPFFWLPSGRIAKVQKQVHVDLERWTRLIGPSGFPLLETTDNPPTVLDYGAVRRRIEWIAANFQLKEICYDPWNASNFFEGEGGLTETFPVCIKIEQWPKKVSPAMKFLMEKVLAGKIRHGGHQVLDWNADCVSVKTDTYGNIAPAKDRLERDGKRIDGISALVNTLVRLSGAAQQSSAWQQDVVVI